MYLKSSMILFVGGYRSDRKLVTLLKECVGNNEYSLRFSKNTDILNVNFLRALIAVVVVVFGSS